VSPATKPTIALSAILQAPPEPGLDGANLVEIHSFHALPVGGSDLSRPTQLIGPVDAESLTPAASRATISMPMMLAKTVTRSLSRLGLDRPGEVPFPRQPAPMLLQKTDTLFPSPDWTYEPKWDGFRVLAVLRDGSVKLVSRNGHAFTNLFGPVSDALQGFPTSILLDGEVIAINNKGQPDFEALQARLRPRNRKLTGHLCYMVFDCLYVNGHSLLNHPLEERQAVLWEMQPALQADAVKLTEGFPAEKSERLMKACAHMGLEGVVMKRKGSIYRPGFRSPDWIKVPIRRREEFVIAGYLPSPRGFSTLILGQHDREGKLVYAGFCGTGLSVDARSVIFEELKATRRKTCPFPAVPVLRDDFRELPDTPPLWVKPSVVVEVEYRQRLKDGLRHAALKGLRPEKKPGVIRRSSMDERGPS
jgi:bifunctional non-homologous end joining protein LigD